MKKLIKIKKFKQCLLVQMMIYDFSITETSLVSKVIMKTLRKFEYPDVIFDLKNIENIDSIGIGLFVSIKNIFNEYQKEMVIVTSNPKVNHILETIKLEFFCKIFKTLEDAKNYFELKKLHKTKA